MDIDYRQSAYVSYRTIAPGPAHLRVICSANLLRRRAHRTATHSSTISFACFAEGAETGPELSGKNHTNVKEFLDASYSNANIIDNDS
jgi:hypothetical protein